MNRHQVSRIDLSPEKVDCIVFWTKNPSNMIEKLDSLNDYGILHGYCIDKRLISKMIGADVSVEKDKNQREACGCVSSVDIGLYNTCMNLCQYCYANHSDATVTKNYAKYDVNSPMLCSDITADDKVTDSQVKSVKVNQVSFDDRL